MIKIKRMIAILIASIMAITNLSNIAFAQESLSPNSRFTPTTTEVNYWMAPNGLSQAMNIDLAKEIGFYPTTTGWYYLTTQAHYNSSYTNGYARAYFHDQYNNNITRETTYGSGENSNYVTISAYLTGGQVYYATVYGKYDVAVSLYTPQAVGNGSSISYWNSNRTSLFYHNKSNIQIRSIYNSSGRNSANLIDTAILRWRGVTNSVTRTTSDNYDIGICFGSDTDLQKRYGVLNNNPNAAGLTLLGGYTYKTAKLSDGRQATLNEIKSPIRVFIMTNRIGNSDTILQNNVTHEIGHALGYGGHSYTNGIMGTNQLNGFPDQKEKKHLGQAYNKNFTVSSRSVMDFSKQNNQEIYVETSNDNSIIDNVDTIDSIIDNVDTIAKIIPIEIISGKDSTADVTTDDVISLTRYKVKVIQYIAGNRNEEEMILSSQVGDILELNKEYTVFTKDIKSPYFNMMVLFSKAGFVESSSTNASTLNNYISQVQIKNMMSARSQPEITFIDENQTNINIDEFADVIVTVKIQEILPKDEFDLDNCTAVATPVEFIKGHVSDNILQNLRLKDNIEVGKTYKIYLKNTGDGEFNLASTNGSIIPMN